VAWRDPVFRCETFIDFGGLDWIDLTAAPFNMGLASFAYQRGKQDQLGQFEPGTATIVLLDPEFALPSEAEIPEIPIRIVCDWHDGTTQHSDIIVWSGYIADGVEVATGSNLTDRTLIVPCVDFLGVANNTPMPDSIWAYWLAAGEPIWWLRGLANTNNEAFAGTADFTVFDFGPDSIHAELVTGDLDEGAPISVGSSTPSIDQAAGARVGTTAVVGDLDDDHPWTVAFAFRLDDISAAGEDCWLLVGRSTSVSGDLRWGIRVDDATGEVEAEIRDAGNTVIGTATTSVAGRHDDGEPHVIVARFNITVGINQAITIHTDLDDSSTSAALTGTPRGSGGFIVTGNTSATRPAFFISDIAYWDNDVDPTGVTVMSPVLRPFADDSASIKHLGLWHDQDTAERLDALALVAGWEGVDTEIHDESGVQFSWLGVLTKSTLGEHIVALGSTIGGAAYVLRDGTVRVRDGAALVDGSLAADYATVQAYLSDAQSPSSPSVQYSTAPTTRRRRDRVVNHVSLATSDGYSFNGRNYRAIDEASLLEWGERPLEFVTEASYSADLDDVQTVLDGLLVPDPPFEVGEIAVRPWGDVEAFRLWLLNLELEKVVGFTLSYPDGIEIVDEAPYRVLFEACEWSQGVEVSYRLNLAPV
jgi:hypothetical protein